MTLVFTEKLKNHWTTGKNIQLGYGISRFEYDSKKKANERWVAPYFVLYLNSMQINTIQYRSFEDAEWFANRHNDKGAHNA